MNTSVSSIPSLSNQIGALRYLLACSIVVHHVNSLSGSQWPVWIDPYTVVSLFFMLSGYFGWVSWLRRPHFREFVAHRLRRLLPAYWAVVLLGAIGLVSVSSLSPGAYFTSPQWWRYVGANLALLNFLEPTLPGVFSQHLVTAVNPALWFVKLEVLFTFLLPLFAHAWKRLMGEHPTYWRASFARGLCWGLGGACVIILLLGEAQVLPLPAVGLRYLGYLQHYLWGVALYFLLPRIRLTGAVGCGLLVLFLLSSWSAPFAHTVGWLVVLALVLRLFLSDGPLRCLNRSNLSYGIYLSHCPLVQLALVWSLPDWGVWLMAFSSLGVAYGLYRGVERRWA